MIHRLRGFLPTQDPLTTLPGELGLLDDLGRDLPSMLHDCGFRDHIARVRLPSLPRAFKENPTEYVRALRLAYVRLGFLASGYVNQVAPQSHKPWPTATCVPENIAKLLCEVCALLGRPPMLSYDGYALYNWKRFDHNADIVLGNIDTIQNFVHLYDEHWFILVHVEIEALAGEIFKAISQIRANPTNITEIGAALVAIADSLSKQAAVLKRIPEKMSPSLYFRTFRPYIRLFKDVTYEGINSQPMSQRGETGAQSSIMPCLVALMKIPHQPTELTNHLLDMRNFMPQEHRRIIEEVEAMPSIKEMAPKDAFNIVLEAMATFREIHFKWAQEYIYERTTDPTGTGGTPYMEWLRQLIIETRQHMIA